MNEVIAHLTKHGWEKTNCCVYHGRVWRRGRFFCILDYHGFVRSY